MTEELKLKKELLCIAESYIKGELELSHTDKIEESFTQSRLNNTDYHHEVAGKEGVFLIFPEIDAILKCRNEIEILKMQTPVNKELIWEEQLKIIDLHGSTIPDYDMKYVFDLSNPIAIEIEDEYISYTLKNLRKDLTQ